MERDGPGDAPESRHGDEPSTPEWTIEDFDTFAPFEDDPDPDDGTSGQGILEFTPTGAGDVPDKPQPVGAPPTNHPSDAAGSDTSDGAEAPYEPDDEPLEVSAVIDAESLEPDDDNPDEDNPDEDNPDGDSPDESSTVSESAESTAADAGGDELFEDTVETAFEGGEAIGAAPSEQDDAVEVPDFASFTSEEYVQNTTQEFVDLAAEMARTASATHEPSAISAEIPGLESGVIGLEDVVIASGADPASIPVAPRSNLGLRVSTGLALAVIFFASLYDPLFVGAFMLVAFFLSAGEFYSALMRSGRRPLSLFGLLGVLGALVGTWVWGLIAVPVALSGTLVASLLFYGLVSARRDPMTNAALTVLGVAWIGGMGAFVFEMVKDDNYGWLIVAIVVSVAIMDIISFFVGRRVGTHRLAPLVSPKKTVEGLIAGMLAALLVGVSFGLRDPFDLGSGLALGAIVAFAAPLGDLAVSVMKRSIGVKDMGTLLPGHGGVLDRIDAMLFVIPLAWIAFTWTGLLT